MQFSQCLDPEHKHKLLLQVDLCFDNPAINLMQGALQTNNFFSFLCFQILDGRKTEEGKKLFKSTLSIFS